MVKVKLLQVREHPSGHTVTVWRTTSGRRHQQMLAPGEYNESSLAVIRRQLEAQPPKKGPTHGTQRRV